MATLSYVFENDFTKSLKERQDVILVELSAENGVEKEKFLSQLLKKIEKAKGYIKQLEHFKITSSQVELRSEHGIRNLEFSA